MSDPSFTNNLIALVRRLDALPTAQLMGIESGSLCVGYIKCGLFWLPAAVIAGLLVHRLVSALWPGPKP